MMSPFDERLRDRLVMGSAALDAMIDEPFRVERRLDLGAFESGAQQAAAHAVAAVLHAGMARRAELAVRELERAADRAAGIARGGLDPDMVEVR